jgi:hypothetical protein
MGCGRGDPCPRRRMRPGVLGDGGDVCVWRLAAPAQRLGASGPGRERGAGGAERERRSTKMSAWGMPRRLLPRKDVATPRKALGTSWHRVIQGYPNGATHPRQPGIPPV